MKRRISFSRILTLMLMLFLLMFGVTEYTIWSIAKPTYVRTNEQIGELQHELTAANKTIDSLQYRKEQQLEELQPLAVVKTKGYSRDVGLTIIKESKKYGLRPSFVMGLIDAESDWDNLPPNEANATGLMQVTKGTAVGIARALGFSSYDLNDPITNIKFGTYCIGNLIRNYGDVHTALTAYNMGDGGMQEYVASYGTSRSGYSRTVLKYQTRYEK